MHSAFLETKHDLLNSIDFLFFPDSKMESSKGNDVENDPITYFFSFKSIRIDKRSPMNELNKLKNYPPLLNCFQIEKNFV